jgi:hypothetical protein
MDHALELVVLGLNDDLLDHRSQDSLLDLVRCRRMIPGCGKILA